MKKAQDKYKPAVDKNTLLLLAGSVWAGIGIMLLRYSWLWLNAYQGEGSVLFAATGTAAALLIHYFGFKRIADSNVGRILPMEGKKCMFSFITWKSYLIATFMVVMGVALRHSPIPKHYLSICYTGIGLALILSSVRYFRVFIIRFTKSS
ncbi:MAG: hypothetical protein HOC71_09405 [Candidatus Latescibacteria bacterium]|jgi:hypothetical protein|nr:hypothetical protein [Candidatus Latescibacterota bacterium]